MCLEKVIDEDVRTRISVRTKVKEKYHERKWRKEGHVGRAGGRKTAWYRN